MAYRAQFLRLVASGSLYGLEGFAWGLNFQTSIVGFEVPETVPAGIIAAVQAFHVNSTSSAVLKTVKLNLIGTDGKYVSKGNTVLHDYAGSGVAGQGTGGPVAPQLALALSLRTDFARGRAHAGRLYMPVPGLDLGADGRISASVASAMADIGATLVNACNASLADWNVAIQSNVGAGEARNVTGVGCGRVFDTIRSRRTSLDEDRQPAAVHVTP